MPPFQMVTSGQPRSVRDVAFEVFRFLNNDDLALLHESHWRFHGMLDVIPRSPFDRNNRRTLEFTFDRDVGLVIYVQETPHGQKTGYDPVTLLHGNAYRPHDIPRFWDLMRSSVFAHVEFNTGDVPQPRLPLHTFHIRDIFRHALAAIVTEIGGPIVCYKPMYTDERIFSAVFKDQVEQNMFQIPIPLSDI